MTRVNGRSPRASNSQTFRTGPRWWDRGSFWGVLLLSVLTTVLGGIPAWYLTKPTVMGQIDSCIVTGHQGRTSVIQTFCKVTWTADGKSQHAGDVEVPRWLPAQAPVTLLVAGPGDAMQQDTARHQALFLAPAVAGFTALVVLRYPKRRRRRR